jgi:uncharacterized protein YcbK (DUF882 family)
MISAKELNPHGYTPDEETAGNLDKLLTIMNKVRAAYNKPMVVTSGLRSEADQKRINPKAPKSNHIRGLACDVSDPHGELWAWCMLNMKLMEDLGIYFEDKNSTPTWVHFQIVPPKSGKRIFKP